MNGWRSPRPNSLQIYGTDPLDRNVFQDHEFAPADVTDRPLAMPTDDVQRPAGDVQRPVGDVQIPVDVPRPTGVWNQLK